MKDSFALRCGQIVWRVRFWATLAGLCILGACALTSKNTPLSPRYFSPMPVDTEAHAPMPSLESGKQLRLGRIEAASHLDERLVFRDSAYEFGYYPERRWTETPDRYLKRQLSRVLFEQRGLRHVVSGSVLVLDVNLLSFEEIRAPKPLARVAVAVRLHDQHLVRWEETLTIDQPVRMTGGNGDAVVEALSQALGAMVERIADKVIVLLPNS